MAYFPIKEVETPTPFVASAVPCSPYAQALWANVGSQLHSLRQSASCPARRHG